MDTSIIKDFAITPLARTVKSNADNITEFNRNKKSFRMDKNKKHLRVIGDGNRVFIKCNLGRVEIVGSNTSVWITRNSGPVQFTGNHGRIFIGDQSEMQVVDYVGCDGRVTVLEEPDIMARSERRNQKEAGHKKKEFPEVESEAFREFIVKKEYLITAPSVPTKESTCTMNLLCSWQVTSEFKIRTNTEGDIQTVNHGVVLI